jgi:hypothetical protein
MHLFTNNLHSRHAHSFSLLRYLKISHMYFKPSFSAPRAMKIIIKMTRNEEYMNKCLIIDLCLMVGVSTLTSLGGQISKSMISLLNNSVSLV